MKKIAMVIMCLIACKVCGHTAALLEEGKAYLIQQEYQQAREVFDSVINTTNPVTIQEQNDYLSAVLNAKIASMQMQDVESAKKYNDLLQITTEVWYGPALEGRAQNSCEGAWYHYICEGCGAAYSSRPSSCPICGGTSFYLQENLPFPGD